MKNNKTAKMGILAVVLLLAVAFAAVSTNLNIGGIASVGKNNDEFAQNVVFETEGEKAPYLLDKDGNKITTPAPTVGVNGKQIQFTAPKFTSTGDYVELHYWVKNGSANYDAQLAKIECAVNGTDKTYLEVTEGDAHTDVVVKSGTTTENDNTVKVELAKTYTEDEEASYTITCTINATGVSK